MKFSLLYKNPEKREVFDLTYDLALDRAVRSICPDARRADYFLGVIMKPLADRENIVCRQELLRDFLAMPQLYDDLKVIFNRYDRVKSDWREMRNGAYPAAGSVNRRALLDYTFASLKVTAMFPKTIISFFASISETIGRYEVESSVLLDIRKYCDEILGNDSLAELERTASLFQYKAPENFEFSVMGELDGALRLIGCDLCDIVEVEDKQNAGVFAKLFGKKKSSEPSTAEIENDEATTDDALYLANEALHRIDTALTAVTGDVYEIFYGISGELQFYDAAIELVNYLDAAGIDYVFPEILAPEQDRFKYAGLRDLTLSSEGIAGEDIAPNDVELEKNSDGILIRGRNKTGKTSLLRAIGASQVLAQSGLPVCAQKAEVSIRHGLYSHFSSAEEDFRAGDTSGRFEGEVQIIAKIVDGVARRPYSLILMNETFQTTSYGEGADGMWQILDALPVVHAKYVFVTRLTKLFELADKDRVKILEMNGDYKIEKR